MLSDACRWRKVPGGVLTRTIYDRAMTTGHGPGPMPDELKTWITTRYPDTVVGEAMGAMFFSLNDQHWPTFATIVTTERATPP